ncbi:hypothetical protein VIGAN_03238700 [Vigna angularis var. angularis]|uniref:Uncharacterized protein n=1 Tax=Vigna angularis var. angularis TaxID=157739 RepID=A0A0S3RP72_PHAAN|nr:hypothetical protein VIGAN_03238700 [Vigna angularis var. angularis]
MLKVKRIGSVLGYYRGSEGLVSSSNETFRERFLFSSSFSPIFLLSFPTTPFPNTQSSPSFQSFMHFRMSTAPAQPPVKSQPLHKFVLPFLKWGASGKNHHTNAAHHHRCRRPSSHPSDHASEPDSDLDSRPHRLGSRTNRN